MKGLISIAQTSMFMKCVGISEWFFKDQIHFAKSIYRNITFAHERAGVKDRKILDEIVGNISKTGSSLGTGKG